ncbi:hypothetical protein EV182_004733 [Spiromyces aspiralis]|uniref:Uncharacterized protein n=1 Tax=Spiromyces aspiralis TaxID=68401 RepID=A0ACC1HR21_9FUNG|nr:hypothetical protein EV182_004733 [Spiromyces aspiralis]
MASNSNTLLLKFKSLISQSPKDAHSEMLKTLGKPDHISQTLGKDAKEQATKFSPESSGVGASEHQPPTFMPGIAMTEGQPQATRFNTDHVSTGVIVPESSQPPYYAIYKDPQDPSKYLWFEIGAEGSEEIVRNIGRLD